MSNEDKKAADLQAQPAQFHFTLEIKRAATGKTETYQLVGTPLPPEESKEDKQCP